MLIEVLLFFALGFSLGVIAGLVPGLHPNTVFVVLISAFWILSGQTTYALLAFVVSMAISNTIVNFIPSIFVGAPEPGTCLSVLPGHRFLLHGDGQEALFLTVVGGVSVLLLTAVAAPFLLWFIPTLYSTIHSYIYWLLLLVLIVLLYQESGKKRIYSIFMFLVSGLTGLVLLSTMPSDKALFPSLSGLFGLSVILISMFQVTTLPKQRARKRHEHGFLRGSLAGWIAGMFVGILPGIGSAQAGVLANSALKGSDKDFLVALGGINTANIIFTFIALHAIGKARSGAALALSETIGQVGTSEMFFIIIVALLSCFMASIVTLKLGKYSISMIERISYKKLNVMVLAVMIALVTIFTGIGGLFVSLLCTIIGLSCTGLGVKRMYLMGFLMVPTILYFSGLSPVVLMYMGL